MLKQIRIQVICILCAAVLTGCGIFAAVLHASAADETEQTESSAFSLPENYIAELFAEMPPIHPEDLIEESPENSKNPTESSQTESPVSSAETTESSSPRLPDEVSGNFLPPEPSAPESSESTSEPSAPESSESTSEPSVPESSESTSEPSAPESSESTSEPSAPESSESTPEPSAPESSESTSEPSAPESSESISEPSVPESSESIPESSAPESSQSNADLDLWDSLYGDGLPDWLTGETSSESSVSSLPSTDPEDEWTPPSFNFETSDETSSSEKEDNEDNEDGEIIDPDYDGTLIVTVNGTSKKMDAFDVVCRFVAMEVGSSFSEEAIKAQAVASHTYIAYCNQLGRAPSLPSKTPDEKIKKAVSQVIDQLVYYNGELANTVYSASSAGYTASSEDVWGGAVPYLVSVESVYDNLDPNWDVEVEISADDLQKMIAENLGITLDGDPADWLEIIETTDGGYVTAIRIGGEDTYRSSSGKEVPLDGRVMREVALVEDGQWLLRSTSFSIELKGGDMFVFTTRGHGHGVGMSQYGANLYATEAGYTYDEILKHYYTGITIR